MQKHISCSPKSFIQNSDKNQLYKSKTPIESSKDIPRTQLEPKDVKQWEEERCTICIEHPHNAVILRCSSYDKGCRPYICNTSQRHSNCLDQFCKSTNPSPSTLILKQGNLDRVMQTNIYKGESKDKFTCPLCRGEIYGWFAVEPARKLMNSKSRSCSYETCNFAGNYTQLRKHARSDHPTVRPSAVDSDRQRNWTRLQQETEFSDMVSIMQWVNNGGEEEEEELGLSPPESPYNNLIVSFMQSIVTSDDDTNDAHNDRQTEINTDINRQNNFNNNNHRSNSFNNNLHNYRQHNSFRGNLTESMRQRRINIIRSNRWSQRTNNVWRNRLDRRPYDVRRNHRS